MHPWLSRAASFAVEAGADDSVGFWDAISGWTILFAVGVVGVAVLLSLVLGPLGAPRPRTGRSGGLTRALARPGAPAAATEAEKE